MAKNDNRYTSTKKTMASTVTGQGPTVNGVTIQYSCGPEGQTQEC